MIKYLEGAWEEFEAWIKETIGSDFSRRIRLQDTSTNREMLAGLILKDFKEGEGVFPDKKVLIERTKQAE
jgi:hypothetical protein